MIINRFFKIKIFSKKMIVLFNLEIGFICELIGGCEIYCQEVFQRVIVEKAFVISRGIIAYVYTFILSDTLL